MNYNELFFFILFLIKHFSQYFFKLFLRLIFSGKLYRYFKTKKITNHNKEVNKISRQIRKNYELLSKEKTERRLVLYRKKGLAHITRDDSFKKGYTKINIEKLNKIISIDTKKKIMQVEPRVTIEDLFDFTFHYGLIPKISPEFKGITVGGAVLGNGLESSSFKYGLFERIVTEMEIIIGNGDVIKISKDKNPDLFYAFPGSHGTLGILTLLTIELTDALPFVELKYRKFKDVKSGVNCLNDIMKENSCDFLDAIMFSRSNFIVIEGHMKIKTTFSMRFYWHEIFYRHVFQITQNNHNHNPHDILRLREYLFRYDRYGFWVGYLEWSRTLKKRIIYGWLQSSTLLFRMRTFWKYPDLEFSGFVQDYLIPIDNSEKFIDFAVEKIFVFPIWFCPLNPNTSNIQDKKRLIFSLHEEMILKSDEKKESEKNEKNNNQNPFFIDIGIYGWPDPKGFTGNYKYYFDDINREFEKITFELDGKKGLYSANYYSKELFWKIYDEKRYNQLRKEFQASKIFPDIYEKLGHSGWKKRTQKSN
ncbi:24-dehydrocholesterol reductase [Anaeramoeba ignava]|uniref:Delta(24)-sterol reductase n=1 Tax=Anaeramoeba ignava TaxID=1746090 RepID=A0A9Q0LWM7_ANAIG|nr:24-dehydrocholesterol reductase [Anaeramoeba ignava]